MPYVMPRVLARGVKESPGADAKANVPSYWEECYETSSPPGMGCNQSDCSSQVVQTLNLAVLLSGEKHR